MPAAASVARREELHRRGVRIEWFIVAWNPVEGSFCQNRNVVGTLINHRPTTLR